MDYGVQLDRVRVDLSGRVLKSGKMSETKKTALLMPLLHITSVSYGLSEGGLKAQCHDSPGQRPGYQIIDNVAL